MAIGIIFQFASELLQVNVDGTNVLFRTSGTNGAWATIDNLKLDYVGVCKEHPDLKSNKDWKEEATKRFKDKIKNMKTEQERVNYILEDLTRFGYKGLYTQKQGWRPVRL